MWPTSFNCPTLQSYQSLGDTTSVPEACSNHQWEVTLLSYTVLVSSNLDFKARLPGFPFVIPLASSLERLTTALKALSWDRLYFDLCKYQHQMADPQVTTPKFNLLSLLWLINQSLLVE